MCILLKIHHTCSKSHILAVQKYNSLWILGAVPFKLPASEIYTIGVGSFLCRSASGVLVMLLDLVLPVNEKISIGVKVVSVEVIK